MYAFASAPPFAAGGGAAGGGGGGGWGGAPALAPAPAPAALGRSAFPVFPASFVAAQAGASMMDSPAGTMAIVQASPKVASGVELLPPAQPLFGIVCGCRGVESDFRVMGDAPPAFVCEVASPAACAEAALFLVPGAVLPPGKGIVAYWSLLQSDSWAVLATLDAQRPSTIVRTGWPMKAIGVASLRVCCVLLDSSDVTNAAMAIAANEQAQLPFVQLVARDLGTFVSSFAQRGVAGLGEAIVLPADAVQRWLRRFDEKFRAEGPAFLSRAL